jgi:RNA ligase (TIGR02306 family)
MKLASFEQITAVYAHPNADKLELCKVLGYQCIVPKGVYQPNDLIVFIQPDTVLPDDEWAREFKKYSPKRVKAIKLRGEWSEGIIVSLNLIQHLLTESAVMSAEISGLINVSKYQFAPPADSEKQFLEILGDLPFNMPKTDEERFENLEKLPFGDLVDVSLKIDGQSCTIYYDLQSDKFGVCGRNYEFKLEVENNFTNQALLIKTKLVDFCKKNQVSLALRGENYGTGIQRGAHNPYSFLPKSFACFNVYNLTKKCYERKGSPFYFVDLCAELGVEIAPLVEKNVQLSEDLLQKYSINLKVLNNQKFEGVVIKHPAFSFKIINKHYDSEK